MTSTTGAKDMTLQQVYWAMAHDWYLYTGTCTATGKHTVYVKDDMTAGRKLEFNNYYDLRNWAGY